MRQPTELEILIREHYAALYATALKFVKSPDHAKNVVQEVFIHFWEKRPQDTRIESKKDYLFAMVRNHSLNYLRSLKREQERYNQLEIEESQEAEVFNLMVEEESNYQLEVAIRTLPEQSARIIRMALSGYENKEIARLLQISVNTVKTLKYGAIRKLREYFIQKKNGYKERR